MTLAELKTELVAAHRAQDWELAKLLSQKKAKLMKAVRRMCLVCGVPLSSGATTERCLMHHVSKRYYSRSLPLAIFCAMTCGCFGQAFAFNDLAFVCQTNAQTSSSPLNDVTNYPGFPPWALYMPSASNYTTNGGNQVTWVDMWTNAFHFTNYAATTKWLARQAASLNGYDTLLGRRNVDTYLRSDGYTSAAPHEILMVMNFVGTTNTSAFTEYILASTNANTPSFRLASSGFAQFDTAVPSIDIAPITNKWLVWDMIWGVQVTNRYLYTNNSLAGTKNNNNSVAISGLMLGDSLSGSASSPINVAYIVTFGGTNPATSALPGTNTAARAAMFAALTNYFNLSP